MLFIQVLHMDGVFLSANILFFAYLFKNWQTSPYWTADNHCFFTICKSLQMSVCSVEAQDQDNKREEKMPGKQNNWNPLFAPTLHFHQSSFNYQATHIIMQERSHTTCTKKSTGPKVDPWGTPNLRLNSKSSSLILTKSGNVHRYIVA